MLRGDTVLMVAQPVSKSAACPACGGVSARVHSKNLRRLPDLPSQGQLVRIQLWSRRFRCTAAECGRKFSPSGSQEVAERRELQPVTAFGRRNVLQCREQPPPRAG